MKKCQTCNEIRYESDFYRDETRIDGVSPQCKACSKERVKKYRQNHRAIMSLRQKKWRTENSVRYNNYMKAYSDKIRNVVREAYGNKCACCGEQEQAFLSIDHVNNDGHLDKTKSGRRTSGYSLYARIIREGFPKDKYQVLCMNCNVGKRINHGICPHQSH